MNFYRSLQSPLARASFAAHQLAGKIGAPETVKRGLRNGVRGLFSSPDMRLQLRPGTWDAWTAHPGHERETHAWIAANFSSGAMVDVGAYCGSFCLRYCRRFDQIFAFEASSENFTALSRNIALTGAANVSAVQAAVAPESGTLRLYLATPDTNSLVGSGPYEEVAAVSLDDHLPEPARVALVKIDVEGAELGVLQGARKLLALRRAVILAEANDEAHAAELREFMTPHGYALDKTLDGRNLVFRAA